MKLISVVLVFFIFSTSLLGQKNQVCFTFDDLTFAAQSFNNIDFQKAATIKLLNSLNKQKIQAIGFVNEFKLYNGSRLDSQKVNLLKLWLQSGMELGNHTFSHMDYNAVSGSKYFDDIIKGEKITKQLMNNSGKTLKYFRHPYLHEGESKVKADSLLNFLKSNGYEEAPITTDNSDYIFDRAYDSAIVKKDSSLMKQIGKEYVNFTERKLKYFEKEAEQLFGRNIKQIALFHANTLNADYIEEIVRIYMKNNYEFIPLMKALEDEAYTTEITTFGKYGVSRLDRWAMSKGKKGSFFKDEPATPEYIMKLAKTDHE